MFFQFHCLYDPFHSTSGTAHLSSSAPQQLEAHHKLPHVQLGFHLSRLWTDNTRHQSRGHSLTPALLFKSWSTLNSAHKQHFSQIHFHHTSTWPPHSAQHTHIHTRANTTNAPHALHVSPRLHCCFVRMSKIRITGTLEILCRHNVDDAHASQLWTSHAHWLIVGSHSRCEHVLSASLCFCLLERPLTPQHVF